MSDIEHIAELFEQLIQQPLKTFPQLRQKADAPDSPGVYLIYAPKGELEHVGETKTLVKRLGGHMRGASSYVEKSLNRAGAQLRQGYRFRYLIVDNPRWRMLLQAMAIGRLCPRHIGDRTAQ